MNSVVPLHVGIREIIMRRQTPLLAVDSGGLAGRPLMLDYLE